MVIGRDCCVRIAVYVLIIFCFLNIMVVSPVSAGWGQTITHVDSTYEVKTGVVHVTKEICFINNDNDTRYWQGYYSSLNYYIPPESSNISSYDSSSDLRFYRAEPDSDYFVFEFNDHVWYGESYTFTIEYDILASPSSVMFYVQETGDSADVTLIVTNEYETHVSAKDYVISSQSDKTIYAFGPVQELESPFLVACVNQTDLNIASSVVPLESGNVTINVEYWDGEYEWAQRVLDTAGENLPLLEQMWGIPYPGDGNITITECSFSEMNGYKGFNNGNGNISILHSASDEVLIHELAHCWTRGCRFDELWMHEGYANFYTYLVLNSTDPAVAASMKSQFFDGYEQMESVYDFDLNGWSVPTDYNESNAALVDYGYDKSFVMVYSLYKEVGLGGMKDANNKFSSSWNIDDYDHRLILQSVSGKDLGAVYDQFM